MEGPLHEADWLEGMGDVESTQLAARNQSRRMPVRKRVSWGGTPSNPGRRCYEWDAGNCPSNVPAPKKQSHPPGSRILFRGGGSPPIHQAWGGAKYQTHSPSPGGSSELKRSPSRKMESAWYYPRTGQATPQKAESRIMGQSAANNPAHQPRQWTCGGASKNQKKAPCHICSAGNYLHAQKKLAKKHRIFGRKQNFF